MSDDQQMPPPPPPSEKDAKRQAKADTAAEKARAKAERPWFKKKRFIIPLALLLLIIIISVTSSGGEDEDAPAEDEAAETAPAEDEAATAEDETATAEDEAAGEEEAVTTGIGSPARDGSFEFTVNSFECGETTVGDEFFEEEAQGQYCLMSVRVENIGDSAQLFSADNQYVFNEEGTQYSASFEATFANNPEGDELFTEINPGNAVEGVVVFDVPESAELAYAELHDSPFSGGVRVELQ
jgi:hypothetical protein